MTRPFLTARWAHLCLLSYAVAPERIAPYLPPGIEPDTRDGQAFVSLVAFDFLDTRVFGIPWPGFRDFPEVNLRCYARRGDERGVVFIRELVPQRLVAWLARRLFNEPYLATPMTSTVRRDAVAIDVAHRFVAGGRAHTLCVQGAMPPFRPPETSEAPFFKEHAWGFGADRAGRPLRFRVEHPAWDVCAVSSWSLDLDWARAYGPEWTDLNRAQPVSVVLATGSPVAVYPATPMR